MKDTFNTVAAMKSAATTLKVEHKKLDIGEIEDLQDDLAGRGASRARRRVAHSPVQSASRRAWGCVFDAARAVCTGVTTLCAACWWCGADLMMDADEINELMGRSYG